MAKRTAKVVIPQRGEVYLVTFDPTLGAEIKTLLKSKWNESYGFSLAFGRTMTTDERRATWKQLSVRLDEKSAQYELGADSVLSRGVDPDDAGRAKLVQVPGDDRVQDVEPWTDVDIVQNLVPPLHQLLVP